MRSAHRIRSRVGSASIALVGLAVLAFGYRLGDPIAGFAVTLFIVHVGYEVTTELVHHLMDGVEPEILKDAGAAVEAVPGVLGAEVAARWTGRTLRLEVEGGLDPRSTLADVEVVRTQVEAAVLDAVTEAREVRFIPRAAWPSSAAPQSGSSPGPPEGP